MGGTIDAKSSSYRGGRGRGRGGGARRGGVGGGGGYYHDSKRKEYGTTWPMSAIGKEVVGGGRQRYGENLVAGDVSPEELRMEAYRMAPGGVSEVVRQEELMFLEKHQRMRASSGGVNGSG